MSYKDAVVFNKLHAFLKQNIKYSSNRIVQYYKIQPPAKVF